MSLFTKILIANRGEIACRIMRTAQHLGIQTVAVFSAPDADALHVKQADEAYALVGDSVLDTYLNIEQLIAIAKQAEVQAIHPGYGFLSENPQFATACTQAGIVFIGPPAKAIEQMGHKNTAKVLMEQAGVPVIPGYHGQDQTLSNLVEQATNIGYPLLIKPVAGGGGKGMHVVTQAEEFAGRVEQAQREALGAFGDATLILERYIPVARHIEVQVFVDTFKNGVFCFERDCSIQRRHQKVLEEAPAVGISESLRQRMGECALNAALAIDYVGAGTVEFLLDTKQQFYFMEMNTRLQVEHPVTEMITGIDLVHWQLLVAAGEPLPLRQDQLNIEGHAIEVRIYAEDPMQDFLPSSGTLRYIKTPQSSPHIRIDSGVVAGDKVSIYYDPMLAKLITWDIDRDQCLVRLQKALAEYHMVGVTTNLSFLSTLVRLPDLQAAQIDIGFIEQHQNALLNAPCAIEHTGLALATLAALLRDRSDADTKCTPWTINDHWRLNYIEMRVIRFNALGHHYEIVVREHQAGYQLNIGDKQYLIRGTLDAQGLLRAEIAGVHAHATVIWHAHELSLLYAGWHYQLDYIPAVSARISNITHQGALSAPLPGTVINVLVKTGEHVHAGDALITIEAMKMEHTLKAPSDGVVTSIFYAVGDKVEEGMELLTVQAR